MIKKIFLFLIAINFTAFANDTLKLKPAKHMIGLGYGVLMPLSDNFYQPASTSYDFAHSPIKIFSANYGYGLNSKTKNPSKLFYLNADLTYSYFIITKTITQYYPSHFSSYKYSPSSFFYDVKALSFSLRFEYLRCYESIYIMQSIGFSSTFFMNDTKDHFYDETTSTSSPYQDTSLISPSNPNGWGYHNSTTTVTKKDNIDNYQYYFTPLYSFGIGFRIKHFVPFMNAELSFFNFDIKSPLVKAQVGLRYQF